MGLEAGQGGNGFFTADPRLPAGKQAAAAEEVVGSGFISIQFVLGCVDGYSTLATK